MTIAARQFWAVLLGVLSAWVSFWAITGAFFAYQQHKVSALFLTASKAGAWADAATYSHLSNVHAEWIQRAILFGGVWPIPVIIAVVIGWSVFNRVAAGQRAKQE